MELRDWVTAEHAGVLTRFERSIEAVVPVGRWCDPAGAGGSSIAALLFHTSYHADLAITAVVCGGEPLVGEWRSQLGLDGFDPAAGLAEAEDGALTEALDLPALAGYARAVHAVIGGWLADDAHLGAEALARVPDAAAALGRVGVSAEAVGWLYAMWTGQPVSFYLQWEAIGHRLNHLGEMVSVRNRLGLSPF